MRDAAGEFHHFNAALDVALGVENGLAMLAGENLGELVVIALQQLQEFHQHAGAALGIGGGPGGLGGAGVLHRRAHLGLGSQRHPGNLLAGHGLPALGEPPRCSRDMLAADEMGELLHDVSPGIPLLGDRLSHSTLLGKAFEALSGDFERWASACRNSVLHCMILIFTIFA